MALNAPAMMMNKIILADCKKRFPGERKAAEWMGFGRDHGPGKLKEFVRAPARNQCTHRMM